MAAIRDRLRAARLGRGLSQAALARLSGVDRTYIVQVESGRIPTPGIDKVGALARALGVTVDHLIGDAPSPVQDMRASPTRGPAPAAFTLVQPAGRSSPAAWIVKSVPLVLQVLHAGHSEPVDQEPLLVAVPRDGNYLAMRVVGECMEPEVSPGDIVIIDLDASPRIDDPVVVAINGEQSLRYLAERTAERLRFEAENPAFPDLVTTPADAEILGVLVAYQRLPRRRQRRLRAL